MSNLFVKLINKTQLSIFIDNLTIYFSSLLASMNGRRELPLEVSLGRLKLAHTTSKATSFALQFLLRKRLDLDLTRTH